MAVPIEAVVRFMETRDRVHLRQAFAARDVVIVENFAPFIFRGAGAIRRWALAFVEHARSLGELQAKWGPPQDFGRAGDFAYFTLPTTWTGLDAGCPFIETGAWVFVVRRSGGTWRILSYTWGVTNYRRTRRRPPRRVVSH